MLMVIEATVADTEATPATEGDMEVMVADTVDILAMEEVTVAKVDDMQDTAQDMVGTVATTMGTAEDTVAAAEETMLGALKDRCTPTDAPPWTFLEA